MNLTETPLAGAWVIDLERREDERGYFARTFDRDELAAHGIKATVVQCNTSHNPRPGTVRGMHFQAAPHGEPKFVRCTRGAIHDVIVDLRPSSPTHMQWYADELTADNGRALYVPPDFAHGFQTLAADSDVLYMMGHVYVPDAARGVRWDDPAFGIDWPAGERTISDRDSAYPDYEP